MAEVSSVEYGKHIIEFSIVRRDRSTLEIAVEPDAKVVVVAPLDATLKLIAEKVHKRAAWVRRQQKYFYQFLPRTPERLFVSGETHLYLGRQYRLKVERHIQEGVKLNRGFIVVQSHRPKQPERTRQLVEQWYRDRGHLKFAERLEISLERFSKPETFRPKGFVVREMRQRWGSMTPTSRLFLSRKLIQAPVDAIDYVSHPGR